MPCYSGHPNGMRRTQSMSMLGPVTEPRVVKHHSRRHSDDNKNDGARQHNEYDKVANHRVSDNTDSVSRHRAAATPPPSLSSKA